MSHKPQILVAEDDFDDRYIMTETFREIGFDRLKIVEDGTLIMEYLTVEGVEAVKLIVLDLNMPKLGGTGTLSKLKENSEFQNIPVIIFSTSVNIVEKDICMKLGAQEYIMKPSAHTDYIETCRKFHKFTLC